MAASSTNQQQALNHKAYARVIARAWSDPDERRQFLEDPRRILLNEGAAFPPDVTVKAIENTRGVMYVVANPGWSTDLDVKGLLAAEGMAIPPGVEVKVLRDDTKLKHVVLPLPPTNDELSEEDLEKITGGTGGRYCYVQF
jgi:hypothetical protein